MLVITRCQFLDGSLVVLSTFYWLLVTDSHSTYTHMHTFKITVSLLGMETYVGLMIDSAHSHTITRAWANFCTGKSDYSMVRVGICSCSDNGVHACASACVCDLCICKTCDRRSIGPAGPSNMSVRICGLFCFFSHTHIEVDMREVRCCLEISLIKKIMSFTYQI